MQLGFSFLRSKIARRFVFLFLFSALIPTFLLALVSLTRVQAQLQEQSYDRLQKDTKTYGMALFDRMKQMHYLMQLLSESFKVPELLETDNYSAREQLFSHFEYLGLVSKTLGKQDFMGNAELDDINSILVRNLENDDKKTAVLTNISEGERTKVYFICPFQLKNGEQAHLIGVARPDALWGVGTFSLLPALTELTVYSDGVRIMATYASPNEQLTTFTLADVQTNSRQIIYKFNNEEYIGTIWPLFLKSYFSAPTWSIVLSQKKEDALSSMLEFKRIFPLIILFTLWVILLFSLHSIRRTLNPLSQLKEVTKRLASGDLNARVHINSRDEFEDLGRSFNNMTGQLKKQMDTLAVIDKIDRAILSSLDFKIILSRGLKMLYDFLPCQSIFFTKVYAHSSEQIQVFAITDKNQDNPLVTQEIITSTERDVLIQDQDYILTKENNDLPAFIQSSIEENCLLCSFPIITKQKLFGTLVVCLNREKDSDDTTTIKQIRQITDQLGIALSNARLVDNLEKLSIGTVEALARTVDAKSKWTAGHSERVSALAVKIAKAMKLPERDLEMLYRGGLLHDIGKIGIPSTVLDKPGKLDDDE